MNDISRREFVNTVAKSCLGVSAILSAQDLAGIELATNKQIATAKSVIFLYMSGGMTHVDTLDPKPENSSIMGETTAIDTSADGIQLGSWLPKTAQQMHNATLIRSLLQLKETMLQPITYYTPAINVEVPSYTQH